MIDPQQVAACATAQIVTKLTEHGFIPQGGDAQSLISEYVSGVMLAAITRAVPPPSQGLNDK